MHRSLIVTGIACISLCSNAFALDEAAAEALARKSGGFKCHAIEQKKDGPPYKEISGKWKGKGDAEQKLTTHITTAPKITRIVQDPDRTVRFVGLSVNYAFR